MKIFRAALVLFIIAIVATVLGIGPVGLIADDLAKLLLLIGIGAFVISLIMGDSKKAG